MLLLNSPFLLKVFECHFVSSGRPSQSIMMLAMLDHVLFGCGIQQPISFILEAALKIWLSLSCMFHCNNLASALTWVFYFAVGGSIKTLRLIHSYPLFRRLSAFDAWPTSQFVSCTYWKNVRGGSRDIAAITQMWRLHVCLIYNYFLTLKPY